MIYSAQINDKQALTLYTNKYQCPYYYMSYKRFSLKNLNANFLTRCTQYILFPLGTSGIGNTEYNKKKTMQNK